MKEAPEERAGLFPADAQAAEVLEPQDGALHRPASPVAAPFLHAAARVAHEPLEHARLHPGREPAMHRAVAPELPRQVLPFGAVVQDPEDPPQRVTLERHDVLGVRGSVENCATRTLRTLREWR